jgi:hypothetical protein
MAWKIRKRQFTALKHPRGSPERNKLNKSSLTSEFARLNKWLVVDSNEKPLKSFQTISECFDFIKNPDKYKPKKKIKKYTRKQFKSSQEWFNYKRHNLKESLNF